MGIGRKPVISQADDPAFRLAILEAEGGSLMVVEMIITSCQRGVVVQPGCEFHAGSCSMWSNQQRGNICLSLYGLARER